MTSTQPIKIPTSFFLDAEHYDSSLKAILTSAIAISIAHLMTFHIVNFKFGLQNKNKEIENSNKKTTTSLTRKEAFKASYRLTNFLVNLAFSIYGIYTCFLKSSDGLEADITFSKLSPKGITDHIFGYEQYKTFGALQVGYNLWSLPVGILYIQEPPAMIAHHITVITTTSLSALSEFGFRVHSPFFLGMFELSSVPLAICNYFKDHPEWTAKNFSGVSNLMKLVFSLVFFWVRIVLGTPHMVYSIRANYWAVFGFAWGESGFDGVAMKRLWLLFAFLAQCFLALLQYWWAYLVARVIWRVFVPKKDGGNGKGKDKDKKA